jgi:hypothetical protein
MKRLIEEYSDGIANVFWAGTVVSLPWISNNLDLLFTCVSIVQFLRMFWSNKVILTTHDKESWNESLLYVL